MRDSETIDFGDGRVIGIRPTTTDDAEALRSFYAAFSIEDRHRRFFSAFTPTLEWCRSWASVSDRGGFGLLAVASGPDGEEVVAEAGYAVQEDGDGELAVAVAPAWRGWLGTYLVDLLVRHAAEAGVTNLQAEVLLENRPMLAIMRHRGAVDIGHPDGMVRMSIGTTGDLPAWPTAESRRKVLVATAGGRWAGEAAAERAGWATAMCRGPNHRGRGGCPVVRGDHCPLVDGASAIVVMLDPDDETTGQLVTALCEQRPGIPILARRPDDGGGPLPDGCLDIGETGSETFAQVLSVVGMAPDAA